MRGDKLLLGVMESACIDVSTLGDEDGESGMPKGSMACWKNRLF